jgi:2-C-methyl-D-erythritol 2,4-cyclodiphosphate synthase
VSSDRIGIGYDIHRLGGDGPLILGGVSVPHSQGLIAHSDGDVLVHALIDALLGALALGDIGQHFPDDDARYTDISSRQLLRQVRQLIGARGHRVVNVDASLICEAPRLAAHLDAMRGNLADDLGCGIEAISIKATTHEGLGAIGRGEGVAAHAVALLSAD